MEPSLKSQFVVFSLEDKPDASKLLPGTVLIRNKTKDVFVHYNE